MSSIDAATMPIDIDGYLRALETFDEPALERIFHPDVVQRELPNALTPAGAVRDFAAIREGFRRGRQTLASQRYTVKNAIVDVANARAALELEWEGTLQNGATMRASFAMFLRWRDGKVIEQTNYDCFWPHT